MFVRRVLREERASNQIFKIILKIIRNNEGRNFFFSEG